MQREHDYHGEKLLPVYKEGRCALCTRVCIMYKCAVCKSSLRTRHRIFPHNRTVAHFFNDFFLHAKCNKNLVRVCLTKPAHLHIHTSWVCFWSHCECQRAKLFVHDNAPHSRHAHHNFMCVHAIVHRNHAICQSDASLSSRIKCLWDGNSIDTDRLHQRWGGKCNNNKNV